MTITELINSWCPKAANSRTFLISFNEYISDEFCDFMLGKLNTTDFYTFLESNSNICINHDYTTIRPNHYLNDKYINMRVENYTFYRNDLFIFYRDPDDKEFIP